MQNYIKSSGDARWTGRESIEVSMSFVDDLIRRAESEEEENAYLAEANASMFEFLEKLVGVDPAEEIMRLSSMVEQGIFFCQLCGEDDQGKYPNCGCEARINNEFQNGGLESCGMGCHGCALCE
jgi:hypothetical protein